MAVQFGAVASSGLGIGSDLLAHPADAQTEPLAALAAEGRGTTPEAEGVLRTGDSPGGIFGTAGVPDGPVLDVLLHDGDVVDAAHLLDHLEQVNWYFSRAVLGKIRLRSKDPEFQIM